MAAAMPPNPAPITSTFCILKKNMPYIVSKACFYKVLNLKYIYLDLADSEVAAAHITTPKAILFIKSARL